MSKARLVIAAVATEGWSQSEVPGGQYLPGLGLQAPGGDLGVSGLAGQLRGGTQVRRGSVVTVQVDQGRGQVIHGQLQPLNRAAADLAGFGLPDEVQGGDLVGDGAVVPGGGQLVPARRAVRDQGAQRPVPIGLVTCGQHCG